MTNDKGHRPTQYIIDEQGRRQAVIIKIREFEQLLEDLNDLAAVAERRDEETVSHAELIADLKASGKI